MSNAPFDAAQYDAVSDTRPTTSETAPQAPSRHARLDLDGEWKRVSPRYVGVEVVTTLVWGLVLALGAALVWLLLDQMWAVWVGSAVLLITVIVLVIEPRRVRSIGYQLRDDDLLFRSGILFQRFVAVPYGRMQLVDITRGPAERWLGLADLKFVTAAATTAVSIPGLRLADAEALRDRLVELAESRRAGL